MSVEEEDRRVEARPCEACGSQVVSGLEPVGPERYDSDGLPTDEGGCFDRVEWCTNLDCPSNRCLEGLHRVGVNDYVCLECGETLRTPTAGVFAHRRRHGGRPEEPGTYTYI
ncbi:hypothetical protein NOK12_29870 [Nocardioides sp. OK12]|nr:hypothetical protein NOK12_29870 [Nocardioides sp. OK12]